MQVPGDVALGGLIQSQAPLFIPQLASEEDWPSESQHLLHNETPLHGYFIVIIIYVALYSLKHSIKPIFSSNPQNKPVRTEWFIITIFCCHFHLVLFYSFHFSAEISTYLCITLIFFFFWIAEKLIIRLQNSLRKVLWLIHS